jgi:3D (Asp-Asp-Asp) domain-containing protein
MTRSLFGGSAAIATALLTASTLFYSSPLVAEAALAPHATRNLSRQEPTSAQDPKKPAPPAPLAEISLNPSELVATPLPAPPAPSVAVPVTVDVLPAPPAPKPAEEVKETPVVAPQPYVATAYSLPGRTATGRPVAKGIIAADPRILPFGTRVHLDAGPYSGEYLVADAGGAVKGRKIDVWVPSNREALRFGRRNIKLTVLSYGAKKKARAKK